MNKVSIDVASSKTVVKVNYRSQFEARKVRVGGNLATEAKQPGTDAF